MTFFLTLILLLSSAFAATFRMPIPNADVLRKVSEEYEIVRRLPEGFEVYVLEARVPKFLKLVPGATRLPEENLQVLANSYRTYKSVEAELKDLAAAYPQIVKLETYGKTSSGHVLYVLKVSDNVSVDEDEPELMITSATHGDEVITVEVEMELIQELLKNYEKDSRLTKMIKDHEIFFIPMVNPQGYSRRERYANMTDPNRDYPYPENPSKSSVDCIEAIRKFFHSRDIKGSIDLHAYGKLIMYPWAYTKASPPKEDEAHFQYVTNAMAEQNKYEAGQISKIIYVAKGSSADYYYWKNKTFALGIELTYSKAPSYSDVPGIVNESREMVWRFIENF
jgi:hypothetical protein